MTNNIFINQIDNNVLYDFLKLHCQVENDYYIFDKLIYKKYHYNNTIVDFIDTIKHIYKPSKQFYLEREMTFNNLLTIIRQICKKNNIPYFSKIKYDKNTYNIIYYIKIII